MLRPSLRKSNQMRPVSMETGVNKWAEGSCLIKIGGTHVLCTASIDFSQPTWKRIQNKTGGWVTAEYSMLPRANGTRRGHEAMTRDNRAIEISRLIGRSLRSVVDMEKLGRHTITIDCDVLQGDGGTRCASITGGFVALSLAVRWLLANGRIHENPISDNVVAVSAGLWHGELVLDLDYDEDCEAELDSNFVVSGSGDFIEIQATGEQHPFTASQLTELMAMAQTACRKLTDLQNQVLD
ncbi:MAG: ribonuclease PH [Alphaproteobacteria bacterium]|nr:ribonuclease PH [Alphaproteobacteria bacterium]